MNGGELTGVALDVKGTFLFGFSYKLSRRSVWGKSFQKFVIVPESSNAIELLSALESQLLPNYNLIHGIIEVLNQHSIVDWKHLDRDINIPTDILAKESLFISTNCIIFYGVPLSLRKPLVVNLMSLNLSNV